MCRLSSSLVGALKHKVVQSLCDSFLVLVQFEESVVGNPHRSGHMYRIVKLVASVT